VRSISHSDTSILSTRGMGRLKQLPEARCQHFVGEHSDMLRVVDELRDPVGAVGRLEKVRLRPAA
jgi:hypothetical protein